MDLLTVPLKKSNEVDFVKPMKSLILNPNKQGDNSQNIEKINTFNKMRNQAVFKVFEKNEAALESLYTYFDQLSALEPKISSHEFNVPFKYKDAFDKGSIFGGRASMTMSSLAFEKVGVLFNIAALQSAIAAVQSNAESDEGLKKAAIFFQQSAGIFNHLKSSAPALGQEPTPDLNPETLNVLSNLMLAQAQEIFVFKAIKDGMKDLIIAKLSNQAVDMYGDVLKAMQKESLKTLWDKEWIPTVAGKVSGFQALTLLFQAAHLNSTKKIGECISLLGKSIETFKTAQSRMGKPSYLDEYAKRAQRNLVDAKKENEFIYNASIPNADTVESPGKAQLAKAMPLTPPLNSNFKDLFNDLVPVALQQALNMCDGQKAEIVGAEVRNLRDSTQTLNGVLSSLNLPAAIEVAQPGSSLPPSLLEKANEVREKGGIDSIRKLIEDLPESLTRNQEILDETEKMLNEEEQSDNQLRNQFKEKWTRTKSESLNGMFRTSVTKYREIINNAVAADKVVRQKFENNSRYIELLSKSPSELHAAIPAGGENVQSSSAVIKLRHLMESVETIKAERDVIESELKSATVDLKSQFLSALAADGAVDPQLVISEVGKSLNPLQKQVAESKARQETLISDIQQAHQQFTAESGAGSNQRDQILSHLATAYDTFTELQHNLKEGTKFYNDLTQLLIVFQSKVSDFCFARKTEKEELMKDLTAESSRQAAGNAPSIPSHHENVAPSRPPQPSAIPAATAAAMGSAPNVPYPVQMAGMPAPYGGYANFMPPMPTSFNPYATLPMGGIPYPQQFAFPQANVPGAYNYGTYPGAYGHQIQQGGYPHQPPQNPQDPNKPYGF